MPFLELAFNLPVNATYTYASPHATPIGCRVQAPLGRRKLTGWVVGHPLKPPAGVEKMRDVEKAVDAEPLFDENLLKLAQWLANLSISSLGETLSAMLPSGRRAGRPIPDLEEPAPPDIAVRLNAEQQKALDAIVTDSSGFFYLYGVTGSGKTEVFLRAAEVTLKEGRGVIYLVPEIALTYHLVEGISQRFPGIVALIHSGLTASQRLTEWRRIQSGQALFVIGARSAVFAPLDPGLIIIDEEHEGSYKSSSSPRYHARQVAMRRCRQARLLMGSATPSLEAWKLMREGRLKRLDLFQRPAGGSKSEIRIVDVRKEGGLLSSHLIRTMTRVLEEERQALLFLNRRGFHHRYACQSCGEEIICRHCSVPLTYHKSRNAMMCHYCGFRSAPPATCSACGSLEMYPAGFGTEKVEEEVARMFPDKRIARLDGDSVRHGNVLSETLRDFRKGRIDILLGTQMVAKGLNAPGVKLAAVLSADTTLNLPDFRSAERTFALIVQVAGRAGRFMPDGEVIVQTFRPDTPAICFAAEDRIAEFYEDEIEQRRALGFPPFSRLFRIVARGADEARVRRSIDELAASLAQSHGRDELLGPAECPVGRIAGSYRRHIILRSASFNQTHAAVSAALAAFRRPHGIRIEVDIDPVSLL